jgi:hypothetical protein
MTVRLSAEAAGIVLELLVSEVEQVGGDTAPERRVRHVLAAVASSLVTRPHFDADEEKRAEVLERLRACGYACSDARGPAFS